MKITDLNGKNICILGYGREGKAMVAALETFAPEAEITIADRNGEMRNENGELKDAKYKFQLGVSWLENMSNFDVIIKSPGIPPAELSHFSSLISHSGPRASGPRTAHFTTSTQIFLDSISDQGATIIGVTGSKGKSTTSSLIAAILKEAKKDVLLVGNIGEPAIAHLADVKKGTYIVMEMSSYQLMDLTVSPHIAVVTSFFPDHLDYHGSLEDYLEAKKHIARFQVQDDMMFFNETSKGAIEIAKEGEGRKIPFSAEDAPVKLEETNLIGEHNLSNIGAATLVASNLGISDAVIVKAIKKFHGLPHRLQFVGNYHGMDWVDDAISTTPESTIAGIRALEGKVTTIILGGQDRGYQFDELAEELISQKIMNVILFPGSGPKIREAIEKQDMEHRMRLFDAGTMEEAVTLAKSGKWQVASGKNATPLVLLSTASPSYGMFKNFEDKGNQFQNSIRSL